MGIISYISFFAFMVEAGLIVFVLSQRPVSRLNAVCAAFIGCIAIWAFSMVVIENPHTTENTAMLFYNISSLGWCSFPVFFLWFTLIFTGKEKMLRPRIAYLSIFIVPLIFIYKKLTGFLLALYPVKQAYGWSYIWAESIWSYLYYTYYISLMTVAVYLLWTFGKQEQHLVKKKQVQIILAGIVVILILGSITDVLCPILKLHQIPPAGHVIALIWMIGVAYAIRRYRFLTITSSAAAENIISTMTDALILTDQKGLIVEANMSAQDLLGHDKRGLIGQPWKEFLVGEGTPQIEEIFRMGNLSNYDAALRNKAGGEIPVSISCSVLQNSGAEIAGMVCIARDVTERKRAEAALGESEERYRKLVEELPEYVFIYSGDRILYANQTALVSLGYTMELLTSRSMLEFIADRDRALVTENIRRRAANQTVPRYEANLIDAKGNEHCTIVNADPVDYRGAPAVMVVLYDITVQKEMDRALQESEAKYRMLVEHQGEGIVSAGFDELITYSNPAGESIFGMPAGTLTGRRVTEFITPGAAERLASETDKRRRGERSKYELEIIRPDGEQRNLLVTAIPQTGENGSLVGTLAILQDNTARKQAETELMQNYDTQSALAMLLHLAQEEFTIDELLNNSIDLILSIPWLALESRGSIFLVENEPDILVMKTQRNLADPIQKACARVPFGKCLCGRAAMTGQIQFADCMDERHDSTYHGIIPHGHYCVPIISAGMTLGVLNLYIKEGHRRSKMEEIFLTEMTDALAGIILRKRAETELRKLSTAVEQSASVIVITDLDANIVYVNQAFVDITGYSREESIGKNPRILKSGDMDASAYAQMWQLLQSDGKWQGEFHNKKKNGNLYWEQATITMLRDEQGKPAFYMAVKEDITMRRALEEERERLIAELQDSLDNIKTLKGLVPICSSCKNIRDDKGYWQQVEVYVKEHTEADFSHGLCEECAQKLYPEYFKANHGSTATDAGEKP